MVNNQLIASAIPVVAEGNQERGLMVNLDANDGDSYLNVTDDENEGAWRDLTKHRYKPDITPSEHFNIVEWTGNGQTNRVIDVGFRPALIMLKQNAGDALSSTPVMFIDSLRGSTNVSVAGGAPYVATDEILGFTDTGFIIGNSVKINKNNVNYRFTAWCWKGNPTQTESITANNSTYTRSLNKKSGFSALYVPAVSGSSGNNRSYEHGLNTSPSIFFAKENTALTTTATYVSQSGVRIDTNGYSGLTADAPSDSGDVLDSNAFPGFTRVANSYLSTTPVELSLYNFAEIRGFSRSATYTGTGDTTAYDVGFKPKLLMVKRVSGTINVDELGWKLYDSKRGTSKEIDLSNGSANEVITTKGPTFSDTGWSWASSNAISNNETNVEYVYMAFADDSVPLNEKLDGEDNIIFRVTPGDPDSVSPQQNDAVVSDVSGFSSHMSRDASIAKNTTTDFLRFPGSTTHDVAGYLRTDIQGDKSFSFWFNVPANIATTAAPVVLGITNLYSNTSNLVQFIVGGTNNDRSILYLCSQNNQNAGTSDHASIQGYATYDTNTRFTGTGWHQFVYTEDGTVGTDKQFYIDGLAINTVQAVSGLQSGYDVFDGILDIDIDRELTVFAGGNTFPATIHIGNLPVYATSITRSFEGKVGEVIIFNEKLSASQVLNNYNKTKNTYLFDGNDAILSTDGTVKPQYNTESNTDFFTLGNQNYFTFEEPIVNAKSISFWVRIREPGVGEKIPIFSNAGYGTATGDIESFFWADDGTVAGTGWFYQNPNIAAVANARVAGSLTTYDTWEHIVFQHEQLDFFIVYQNGVATGLSRNSHIENITSIGRDYSTLVPGFRYGDFDISKFQTYSIKLDQSEITTLYNQGR